MDFAATANPERHQPNNDEQLEGTTLRLIDADLLRENSKMLYSVRAFKPVEGYTQDQIDNAPTVEAAPVVHGRWEFQCEGSYNQTRAYCTACEKPSGIGGIRSNQMKLYCPNCGAKMDL